MKPNLYILSGAGLSTDSGLATFRSGGNATWNHVDMNAVCNYHILIGVRPPTVNLNTAQFLDNRVLE